MSKKYVTPNRTTGELMDKKVYMILDTATGMFAKKGGKPTFTTMYYGKVWASVGRLRAHLNYMKARGYQYDDTCVVVKFGIENFEDLDAYMIEIDDLYNDEEETNEI